MAETYTTRYLANAIIGKDDKSATREIRKFLRADAIAGGGKIGTDTPGKGGRYALALTKRDVSAMKRKFAAWQAEEAKKAEARTALKAAAAAEKAQNLAETDIADIEDDATETPEPADIDAMLAEIANEDEAPIED